MIAFVWDWKSGTGGAGTLILCRQCLLFKVKGYSLVPVFGTVKNEKINFVCYCLLLAVNDPD
jgi:hypothetical protein